MAPHLKFFVSVGRLNGRTLEGLSTTADGVCVEFPRQGTSTLRWR
jgi:hypothetical protein